MLQLSTLIAHHARYFPERPAVGFEQTRLDWGAFGKRVNRVANALHARGVAPGDRVATVCTNCLELLETFWAVPTAGAVLVPLSPLLMAPGLASLLNDAGAKAIVTQRALLPLLAEAELPQALRERILVVDGAEPGYRDYHALAAAAPETPPATSTSQDDLFNIMYTSGTTGLPKGIMHTHFTRSMYCLWLGAAWRMTPESVVLHAGAIVFNGAFITLMAAFYHGARYVLLRQFDAAQMIEAIAREKATHIMVVPSQIIAMLNAPNFAPAKLESLEMILSLGAPLLQEHKDRLNAKLPNRFYELYGLTEGFVTILDRSEALRKSGSVGRPTQFSAMRIVREDGSDAPPGEVGEIVGRSPILMKGYYGRPDLTAQALRDGWLYSGDMGYVDEEGFLYLVDRKKDMIDSGGVKVYPRDVEEVAARHPAVREVAVFGIPHDKWGETPVAAVILNAPGTATAEELRGWINARVSAKYQRLAQVIVLADFPRSAAGKTLKRELRAPYWAGRERNI